MSNPFRPDVCEYAKVCSRCGLILSPGASSCRHDCGKLDTSRLSLLEIAKIGILACYSCGSYYAEFAHVWECKLCQSSLTLLVRVPSIYPLPPNSIAIPTCPKCSTNQSLQTPFCDACGRLLQIEFEYFDLDDVRPTIPIKLRYPARDKTVLSILLIDFGAAKTLLHGYLARQLGIPFMKGTPYPFTGIAQGATVIGYEMPIEIGFYGKFYPTQVCFSDDLPFDVLGMLGHDGFLDRFHVIPDNVKRKVMIKEQDHLHLFHETRFIICPVCGFGIDNDNANYCWYCGSSLVIRNDNQRVSQFLVTPETSTTTGLPLKPVPVHGYQVTNAMQVQSEIEDEN